MQKPQVQVFFLALSLFAAIATGCSESTPSADTPVDTPNPAIRQGPHVYTAADGVDVPYVVHGVGEVTLVMVHCWMCEGSFWDAQVEPLTEQYRVITLDLPGHGEGGDDRRTWTIAGYGEDVAGLIEQAAPGPTVLVGHSMGGPVALRAAALTDRVVGIVAVDTLHDADFDFSDPMVQQMASAFDNDFSGVCNNFVGGMFVEEGVDEIVEKVRRVGCIESNSEAGKALMHDFASLDFPTMFQEAGVPIRAINAAAPNPTRVENNRKYSDFEVVLMEDVGHYLHMTRPDEFNTLLLRTLDRMLNPATADRP